MACQLAGALQRAGGLAIWDQITDAVGVRHSFGSRVFQILGTPVS